MRFLRLQTMIALAVLVLSCGEEQDADNEWLDETGVQTESSIGFGAQFVEKVVVLSGSNGHPVKELSPRCKPGYKAVGVGWSGLRADGSSVVIDVYSSMPSTEGWVVTARQRDTEMGRPRPVWQLKVELQCMSPVVGYRLLTAKANDVTCPSPLMALSGGYGLRSPDRLTALITLYRFGAAANQFSASKSVMSGPKIPPGSPQDHWYTWAICANQAEFYSLTGTSSALGGDPKVQTVVLDCGTGYPAGNGWQYRDKRMANDAILRSVTFTEHTVRLTAESLDGRVDQQFTGTATCVRPTIII